MKIYVTKSHVQQLQPQHLVESSSPPPHLTDPNVLPQATVTIILMRKTSLLHLVRAPKHGLKPQALAPSFKHLNQQPTPTPTPLIPCRALAQVRSDRDVFPEIWFTSSSPPLRAPDNESETKPSPNHPPPDERTLKLGKSTSSFSSQPNT